MQELINFFEKETNKKINFFKYNNEILSDNQSLVKFNNTDYVIEFVKNDNLNNLNGYVYLFYQINFDFNSLQNILYNLYDNIKIINNNDFVLVVSTKKLDIDLSTPDILETETYRNTYIVDLDKIEDENILEFRLNIVKELLPIMIKVNGIGKYIDLNDLLIYKTIDLINKDLNFFNLVNIDNLNNIDDNLLYTGLNFIENGLNISKTSHSLFLHRNTLIYRLEKIKEILSLDLKNFKEAFVFYLSVKSYFYSKYKNL